MRNDDEPMEGVDTANATPPEAEGQPTNPLDMDADKTTVIPTPAEDAGAAPASGGDGVTGSEDAVAGEPVGDADATTLLQDAWQGAGSADATTVLRDVEKAFSDDGVAPVGGYVPPVMPRMAAPEADLDIDAVIAAAESTGGLGNKAKIAIGAGVAVVAGLALGFGGCTLANSGSYQAATDLMQKAHYTEAAQAFDKLGGYQDSAKLADFCLAMADMESGDYEGAASMFKALGVYGDAAKYMDYCIGRAQIESGSYAEAIATLRPLGTLEDADALVTYCEGRLSLDAGDYADAKAKFASIPGVLDADTLAKDAANQAVYTDALAKLEAGDYDGAIKAFESLGSWKDAVYQLQTARDAKATASTENANQAAFDAAQAMMDAGDYEGAIAGFEALGDWGPAKAQLAVAVDARDAAAAAAAAQAASEVDAANQAAFKEAQALMAEGKYDEAITKLEALGDWGQAPAQLTIARAAAEAAAKAQAEAEAANQAAYDEAQALLDEGRYDEAIEAFTALGDYSDAKDKVTEATDAKAAAEAEAANQKAFDDAKALLDEGKYDDAIAALEALGDWGDAPTLLTTARDAKAQAEAEAANQAAYDEAQALLDEGRYDEAIEAFTALGDYSDAKDKVTEATDAKAEAEAEAERQRELQDTYDRGEALVANGELHGAVQAFESLGDWGDAAAKVEETKQAIYDLGISFLNSGDYANALTQFESLGDWSDAAARATEARSFQAYANAVAQMDAGDFAGAAATFQTIPGFQDSDTLATYCSTRDYAASAPTYEAVNAYLAIDGILDAHELALDAIEADPTVLMDHPDLLASLPGLYDERPQILAAVPGLALMDAQVGDIVTLGSYEQDGDAANGTEAIQWIVIARDGDQLFLLSKDVLSCQPYYSELAMVDWEVSTLRWWLNNTFAQTAFTPAEYAMLVDVTHDASIDDTPYDTVNGDGLKCNPTGNENTAPDLAGTPADPSALDSSTGLPPESAPIPEEGAEDMDASDGQDGTPMTDYTSGATGITVDRVFLLSVDEVEKYLTVDWRQCVASAQAQAEGVIAPNGDGLCNWWLRSMDSRFAHLARYILPDGRLPFDGNCCDFDNFGARPAIVVDVRGGADQAGDA